MGMISQRCLLGAVLCMGCKSAPETAPVPATTTTSTSEAPTTPAPAERSQAASIPAQPQAPRVYDETAREITAHVGERFEVALPGNITTPLKWTLDPASMSDLVTLSAQSYSDTPPPECSGCVGYPGTAHFMLDAAQEGITTLRFAYRKLGQTTGQAKRNLDIELTVTQ